MSRHIALPDSEYDPEAEEAELQLVARTWHARYQTFAQVFAAAVQAEAALIPGLQVQVAVEAITDPEADVSELSTDEYEYIDPLVDRLWAAALQAAPVRIVCEGWSA